MKRLFVLIALILTTLTSVAQDAATPIVPLTERIFLTTERSTAALGDVLKVRGAVLSTDYADFKPYSRYVNIELIGTDTDRRGHETDDRVIVRQKVSCDPRGYFYATLPTDACRHEGRYYLRAYTRFMRNRPVETFPMTSVLLTYDARRESSSGGACVVTFYPEGGRLMSGVQQQLVAYVTDAFGHPVDDARLAIVDGADTLATALTRRSGYAALTLTDGALVAAAQGRPAPHVSIVRGDQHMTLDLPAIQPAAPFLRAYRTGQKLRVQVVGQPLLDPGRTRLYAFQSGFGLQELTLPAADGVVTLDTSEMPDGLMTFWLTTAGADGAAPEVVSQRSVWVGGMPVGTTAAPTLRPHIAAAALAMPDATPDSTIVIRHIVGAETATPRAFEMLHLSNVRSLAPFPAAIYAEAERDARTDLDLWLTTARFVAFDVADALAGAFDYPLAPERALTISGTALTPDGRRLKAGNVEMLNLETMDSHVAAIADDGHYEQAVADYADGDRFFIESVDTKHKGRRYGVTVEEETPAALANWLRAADEASAHTGRMAHTVVSGIAGGIDLGEAVVTARSDNRPDIHASQMEGIYVFSHETLQQPQYVDIESVLRRSGWVDIQYADTDSPAPKYLGELAERLAPGMLAANDPQGKMPINKVCIYRSERTKRQSLQEGGSVWMNFLLNDVLVTRNFEDILSMSVDGLESIEIVKPTLSDPRLIRNNSMNGLVIIKSRHVMKAKDIPSAGINVRPAGLALPIAPDSPTTALRPDRGERIGVEVITPDRRIVSWEE